VHGAYVREDEIERVVDYLKEQGTPHYDESILAMRDEDVTEDTVEHEQDALYDQAVALVAEARQASISLVQRRLRIGYNRAARLVESLEAQGVIGPAMGSKPRQVFISPTTSLGDAP